MLDIKSVYQHGLDSQRPVVSRKGTRTKTQHCTLIYSFKAITIKIPDFFLFVEIDKLILKLIWKSRGVYIYIYIYIIKRNEVEAGGDYSMR